MNDKKGTKFLYFTLYELKKRETYDHRLPDNKSILLRNESKKPMQDSDKMEHTLNLSEEALENGEMPIAAILFQRDKVITKAYTSENKDHKFLVHAELKALMDADGYGFSITERRDMQLFTTLEPCLMCFGAAMSFFVGEVVYSLSAPDDGVTRLVNFEHFSGSLVRRQLPSIRGGLLKVRAKEQLKKYLEIEQRKYLREFAEVILGGNSYE